MTAVYTSVPALLQIEATTLASQATAAGLSSLATALTNVATEISNNISGGYDFYGGTTNSSVNAGSFVVGTQYVITFVGTTNFTLIGSSANTPGVSFYATGAGTGSGTATVSSSTPSLLNIYPTILANASQIIKNANIASQTTAITGLKSDLDTLATNSTSMLSLAQGTGIHMVGPYDWLGFASIYHLYVEQAKLADHSGDATPAQQAAALAQLQSYLVKIQSLPTLF